MQQCLPFIEALNRESGMQIELSEGGSAAFAVDGRGILLQWSEARSSLVVYAELEPLAGYRDSEIISQLMSSNFLLQATQGGTLSLDPTVNMIGLNYPIALYGLSPDEFVRIFDAVVELAQHWREEIRGMIEAKKRIVQEQQKAIAVVDGDGNETEEPAEMLCV